MSLFFLFAFLLLVLTLGVLLRGLLKSEANTGSNPVDVNVEIARENKKALEHALNTGELTQESFDEELRQLEGSLASTIGAAKQQRENKKGQWFASALIAVGVPLAAGLMYLNIGEPGAITAQPQQQQAASNQAEGMPPLEELLPNLEARLQDNPDDVRGWKLLGRSYLMVGQFDKAALATRRALALDKQDADTNAQLAEAIAMQQQGEMRGEPISLVNAALAIDPGHQQATWLSAIADQQRGEHQAAIEKFEALQIATKDDANAQRSITEMLNVSRAAIGQTEGSQSQSNEPQSANSSAPTPETNAEQTTVTVRAELADSVSVNLPDTTSVFIYARASNGPPMPLAVSRVLLKDLPVEVTLDDSMAMIPNMTLSEFSDVIIGARVSPSGNAIRQPGDWMGETDSVSLGSDNKIISVTIDNQVK